MKQVYQLTHKELEAVIYNSPDDALSDEAYNELEKREEDERMRDHTESDRDAAWSERYEMFYKEY